MKMHSHCVDYILTFIAVYQTSKPLKISTLHYHNACRECSTHTQESWRSMQDVFYKSKISSHFPNFEDCNAWQTGHNSQEDCFPGQELLLDLAAGSIWLQMPITRFYQFVWISESTFWFFKMSWWLSGLSGFLIPLNHLAGMAGM